jgi:outer membrane protein assembly factor BamB
MVLSTRKVSLPLAGLLLVGSVHAAAADWPGWRGPARDAISPDIGLLTRWPAGGPPLLYRATGLGSGLSSVALVNGRIFTMGDRSQDQYVMALDQKDGKILWSTKVGPAWVDEYGGPRATPTVDGKLVYALGTEGDLVAVEAATGKEQWRRNLPRDFGGSMMSGWKFSESPLVDGPRLVVTPGARGAGLVALDKLTGKEIWRTELPASLGPAGKDGAGYSATVISQGAGVKQYVQLMGRGLVGVRATDGKLLWSYNRVANNVANISTPLVKGDLVFASTGYQTGSALVKLTKSGDGVSAQEVYFLDGRTFQNHHGGMVLIGDHVYGGHGQSKGFPIAIELATGKVAWGGDIRNAGSGSAAVTYADGHLYFRYQNGVMVLIEATPDGYKEKGSFEIPDVDDPSWSHPVVLDGRLYLREQDTLNVYDVKRKS